MFFNTIGEKIPLDIALDIADTFILISLDIAQKFEKCLKGIGTKSAECGTFCRDLGCAEPGALQLRCAKRSTSLKSLSLALFSKHLLFFH